MSQNYQLKVNQELYLATRLDLNTFFYVFSGLQCLNLVSNEMKVGLVIQIDRSENIFFGFMNTVKSSAFLIVYL